MKAEDPLDTFNWWARYDEQKAKKYADIFMKTKNPTVFIEMMNERIYVENQLALEGSGLETPGQKPNEESEPREKRTPTVYVNQKSLFSKKTFFSIISSDIPIKDIIFYIQNEVATGRKPKAYTRREVWGEQRGGLCPHPDAQPIRVRDDGTFIYSPDDLGYDPETGLMNCSKEERGTYAGIPVGAEIEVIAVDPKERMIKIQFSLEGDAPNHSHIHIWVPLKDIDLV
jgi:hypothetical protein